MGDLKVVWDNLFVPNIYSNYEFKDKEILGILMLLETAVDRFTKLACRCANLMESYSSTAQELEEMKLGYQQLKENFESVKLKPCGKCSLLKMQLKEANHKAEEAQTRMNSIAKILALGEDTHSKNSKSSSAALLSQILLGTPAKGKVKDKEKSPEVLVPETEDPATCIDVNVKDVYVIPETVPDEATQILTNNKLSPSNKCVDEGVVKSSPNQFKSVRRKKLSNSVNIPPVENNQPVVVPKKNLSAEFIRFGKENVDSLKKTTSPKKLLSSPAGIHTEEDESSEVLKSHNSELERIWFNDKDTPVISPIKKTKNVDEEAQFWKLKEKRGVPKEMKNGGKKRLKQMTLGVVTKEKKDLSLLSSDMTIQATGSRISSAKQFHTDSSETENEEIVYPSPKRKSRGPKKRKGVKSSAVDLSLFAPLCTSTQVSKEEPAENSFDRIPTKKKESPKYKYKREAVKKREERAKLPGQQCDDCKEYYKVTGKGMGDAELQGKLNACSRHRDKYNMRLKSPPGFWDPGLPDTQECRERGMYTSVYRIRDS